jgi:hypothetical protein
MSTYNVIRNAFITSTFGALLLLGSVSMASAQDVNAQYRQWQRAQQEAAQRQQDYLRTRSGRDYQQWQRAQARAQREYNDYQRAQSRYNGSYNNNNRYYNPTYGNSGMLRVYRNGSYYEVNARGAAMLRQAVRNGYQQGYREGQVDRRYGRGYDYNNSRLFRSGTYGWSSAVSQDQYQYYFREGFQRGYEDGYNNTLRYGVRNGNGFNIVGGILNTILNIANP